MHETPVAVEGWQLPGLGATGLLLSQQLLTH
jgi:hypothetical protein